MAAILQNLRRAIRFMRTRPFLLGALSIVMALIIFKITDMTNAVYIRDGENVSLSFTFQEDPHEILRQNNITTLSVDEIQFSGFSGKVAEIEILRAFPVSITCDGTTRTLYVTGGTVLDALQKAGIVLGEHDIVNYPYTRLLSENDHIVVKRVSFTSYSVEEIIPYEVEYRTTSVMRDGKVMVLSPGSAGKRLLTYSQYVIDGEVQETRLVANEVLVQPTTEYQVRGQTGAPCSDLDFGYTLDENGIPTSYVRVLTNQRATGYSSRRATPRGASGQRLYAGSVAVNPNKIPYGTKLYITSADNRFVYGFAIAADTGTGLMANIIDVDLFYETYEESVMNSLRTVNIYILE